MGDAWRFASGGARLRPGHTHVELEVNLVLQGTGRYLVGEQLVELSPGTMIWLFPRQNHLLIGESGDYAMWIGVFKPALLRRICRRPQSRALLQTDPRAIEARQVDHLARERLDQLFGEIAEARASLDQFNAGLGYLGLACWAAYQRGDRAAIGREVHPAVERAARALRDGGAGVDLRSLARHCGLSPSRLSRLFRQQTGIRLVDYRNRQRLDRFAALYGSGRRLTLLEAALAAGFGSYAQFYRVFRRVNGRSPDGREPDKER